jgi:hypothetical protein
MLATDSAYAAYPSTASIRLAVLFLGLNPVSWTLHKQLKYRETVPASGLKSQRQEAARLAPAASGAQ